MTSKTLPVANSKISDAMRDYLGEIFRIGQGEAWVSTTVLADSLNVSGPATVRMVRRLHDAGLVEHLPYKGVILTEHGKRVALLNIRRHRLVERFLVEVLKFPWYDVHDEADDLHRGINQKIEDRMAEIMGHPLTCPHGDPIPTREGVMPELHDKPLNVTPPGAKGQISRVKTHDADKLKYLGEIGIVPGADFELVNRAPFNGPIRLRIGQHEQVIGAELSAALWVVAESTTPK
ncbi:MAG: metal-dependent transcriptional regulator [Anaerolineae bacterium]|nr:metal-dependent transcriptional regulator [Anaerolineae bacterium]